MGAIFECNVDLNTQILNVIKEDDSFMKLLLHYYNGANITTFT